MRSTAPPTLNLRRRHWLAALLVSGAARAEEPTVIRYVGDESFEPFESLDDKGQPQGFQIDLLRALEPVMGVRFDIRLRPWAESEAAMRSGQADLMAMVNTPERRQWVQFAHGHATPALAVYLRRGDEEPQDLPDLASMRVVVPDHEAMRATIASLFAERPAGWTTRPEPLAVLEALRNGEAEAALLPRAYADHLLAGPDFSGLVSSGLVLRLQAYAFATRPGNDALIERLQTALHTLERDGTLEALRTLWLGSHRDKAEQEKLTQGLQQQTLWTWGIGGASAVGLSALGALAWRRGQKVLRERERRRAAEAALARAEELLERSFTLNPSPMLLVERGSSVVRDTNAALQTLLGVPARTLVGSSLQDLGAHIDADMVEALIHKLDEQRTLNAVPVKLMRADGQTRECLVSADPLSIAGVEHVFCVLRDVTDELARDVALKQAYDTLAGELDQLRRELDQAQGRQQRAEQSLQEFTRVVSHDLRAPLIAMQGFVGLLRERLRGGHLQEAEEYTEHIDRATRRMSAMVSALT
ncbi:MAG: transporter substrate-binding domain-containing protein, partial [Hydrogenophaga sp.]|nr:transporter substrate-binding domain-containing protein [Hydrogenophaga sp.]